MILCWLSVKRKKETNKQTKKQIQVVDCRIIHFWLSNCHLIIWWSDDNITRLLIIRQKNFKQRWLTIWQFIHCYYLCNPGHAIWIDNVIYGVTAIYAFNTMPIMQTMPLMQTMPCMPSVQCQLCNSHNANCAYNAVYATDTMLIVHTRPFDLLDNANYAYNAIYAIHTMPFLVLT